jgi:PAS domain S-box-containing protein
MAPYVSTDSLAISYGILSALVDSPTSSAAAVNVLQACCDGQGWDVAVLWIVDGGKLRAHGTWTSARMSISTFDEASWTRAIAAGHCAPGLTLTGERGCWIDDAQKDQGFSRGPAARRAGLHSGCWMPLTGSSRAVGVLELVSCERRNRDPHLLDALESAVRPIGRFLERKIRNEREQFDSERMRLLIEGIRDYAIVLLGLDGRVKSWNPGAQRIFGFTAAAAIGMQVSRFYLSEDDIAGKPQAQLQASTVQGRFEDEGWHIREGGVRFWANVVFTSLRDTAEQPAGFAMVTSDLTERRMLEDDLVLVNERLRALASRVNAATEEEKGRLSREIHDVLGQELTNLKMDVAWIARRTPRSDAPEATDLAERLQSMISQIDGCVQTVRRIATGLRPGVLDDLGLVAAIDWQVRDFQRRSGINIESSLPEIDITVDSERATALFRILQEVLTNIARHAKARAVSVTLAADDSCLVMVIRDDGCGISEIQATESGSLGILGMRERAALFGGSLDIRGAPGEGTRVMIRLPVPHE